MLRSGVLKKVFFSALALTGLLLLYIYFFVHPAYRKLLIHHTEDEAVRYVSFMVHAYHLDKQPIRIGHLSPGVIRDIGVFEDDKRLIKLRIFDETGRIVFSTVPKEIGQLNEHPYFHQQVAAGQVYSKTVTKDNFTAEMEMVKTDLIETYVPIMGNGSFRGAVETYYDVTASRKAIGGLALQSLVSLGAVSVALLVLLYFALNQADRAIMARDKAEGELRQANEKLEARVAERAGELLRVNRKLSDEIAERTEAQMSLSEALTEMQRAKEKIDGILSSVTDGLLVLDDRQQVMMRNHTAESICGICLADVSGQALQLLDLPPALKEALGKVFDDPEQEKVDFELPRSSGQSRTLQARTSVLRDQDGKELGTVVLMHDVTTEREVERMKSDFLAMAAHELSTPLTAIMGYSELLASEDANQMTDDQKKSFVSFIYDKAESLSCIVDDLLDLSRIESGQEISIAKIDFDLCTNIRRLIDAHRKNYVSHRFELEAECSSCRLFADPIRIEQVVENLLSNATKYSPEGGEVRVICRGDEEYCRFSVCDQGVGMSPDQQSRIFEKFYRGNSSNTAQQGVGLGMSIARHIVESHAGHIEVTSELGKGTCITVALPKSEVEVDSKREGIDDSEEEQAPV